MTELGQLQRYLSGQTQHSYIPCLRQRSVSSRIFCMSAAKDPMPTSDTHQHCFTQLIILTVSYYAQMRSFLRQRVHCGVRDRYGHGESEEGKTIQTLDTSFLSLCSMSQETKPTGAAGRAFTASYDLTIPLWDLDSREEVAWKQWARRNVSDCGTSNMEPIDLTLSAAPSNSDSLLTKARIDVRPQVTSCSSATTTYAFSLAESGSQPMSSNPTPQVPQPMSPPAAVTIQLSSQTGITMRPKSPPTQHPVDEAIAVPSPNRPIEAPQPRSILRRGMQAGRDALAILMAHQNPICHLHENGPSIRNF